MHNYSTALDQTTWGIHLNFDGHLISPTNSPAWLTPLQRQNWQRLGIVVWNAGLCIVTHLYAGYALEIFEGMRANNVWKSNNLVIGSPMYTLSSEIIDGTGTLENQIELAPDQANVLFGFLNTHKKLLEHIAIQDEQAAEDAPRTVFRMIAAYGRKVREGRKDSKPSEVLSPRIHPTFIPRGTYFTVHQAAQICNATSKQVRAWIRKGRLEALDLPGIGIIIETEKLHRFMTAIGLPLLDAAERMRGILFRFRTCETD